MNREIITVAQMRAIDAASARAGVPIRTLMENAGRAVASAVAARHAVQPVTVLCGPGANGGDGWVAARILHASGWPVEVVSSVARDTLTDATGDAARSFSGPVAPLSGSSNATRLYIDALFGAGLSRALEGAARELAVRLPAEQVVAVDVPSGVRGDDGGAYDATHFKAALTVTFLRKKPAHVLAPSRAYCGEVIVADIGTPAGILAQQGVDLWENDPVLWTLPWPSLEAHKHARGHVMVASGGQARTGAARLAARASLRVGAGLVSVLSPADAIAENAAHLTAIMLRLADDEVAFAEAARAASALALGPAFGTDDSHYRRLCAALAATPRCPIVLDADAITLLAPMTHGLASTDVMTPHLGEFRRAFPGIWSNSVSRIEAARAAAAYARCVVLLKGPDTVIAAPNGRAIVNTTGTPYLATAGSGDVLAGLIAGLIGQGMESFEAAAAGAWLHGKVAERLGPGLIAEDLPENLPRVLRDLAASATVNPPDS